MEIHPVRTVGRLYNRRSVQPWLALPFLDTGPGTTGGGTGDEMLEYILETALRRHQSLFQ